MRRALKRQLEAGGYRVQVAEDGTAALQLLESGPVEVVLSEIELPPMGGRQLLAEIRQKLPLAVLLLMSGRLPAPASLLPSLPLLEKPFRTEQLAQVIDQALAGASE